MNESILHYVWQNRLFPLHTLKTTDGFFLEIIDTGHPNSDAGPDFFNAKIKIEDTLWAGNVEIHDLSSDWHKHNHTTDKSYDSVILHVVRKADIAISRTNGEKIPQLELPIPEHVKNNYEQLLASRKWIACEEKIHLVPDILTKTWKSALLIERIEQKAASIDSLLEQTNNDWAESFYISLAYSFGFGTNSQPFEHLAKTLPLRILAKHKDHLFQLEALLFGQAGFLEKITDDDSYPIDLQKEYQFLRLKYNLRPIDATEWKLLRLRPENFPYVRLAQFAALTHQSSNLFSKILKTNNVDEIRKMFQCEVSDYWKTHFTFGSESRFSAKQLGNKSIDILLINTVIPFIFAHAKKRNEDEVAEKSIDLLEEIPAENNAIVRKWALLGLPSNTAFDSQALIQLKKRYCDNKNCLRCRFGQKVLAIDIH